MSKIYKSFSKSLLLPLALLIASYGRLAAQACATAQGDTTVYGANNVWIGYVFSGQNFDNYQGYVNEGSSMSPNFDESFGGSSTTYNTNGCSITTDHFSVIYRLNQTLNGNFAITVGGDDGYRLSLDGGATWVINSWNDQGYSTTTANVALGGSTNLVLEYYEDAGDNRISFTITPICTGTSDTTVYGTGNIWNGYVFEGMNFQNGYKGMINEGLSTNPGFDEDFGNPGGSNTNTFNTNSCTVPTYQYSVRYKLQQTLAPAYYIFTVGGDDGYRLSLDGGNTWVINSWNDQSYGVSSYSVNLSGTYNMVLDYYQNGGSDRISFAQAFQTLPITLTSWSVTAKDDNEALLKWSTTDAVNFDHFVIQRSVDGSVFEDVHTTPGNTQDASMTQSYSYTDQDSYDGTIYYRLMMVDKDGKSTYSNIVSIGLQSARSIKIYPTVIANGSLFVETSKTIGQATFELFDMSGHRLQATNWSSLNGRQQVSLDGRLPAGAYFARLSNGQSTLAKQLVVIQ